MRQIILASTSPRRKELFRLMRIPFVAEAGEYEENMKLKLPPLELAKELSRGKAEAVAKKHKNAVVIGADTFIAVGSEVLGKPHTAGAAKKMLKKLSGRKHSVITGFTIIDTKAGKSISRAVESRVYFKRLTEKEIGNYIKTKAPFDRAGGYDLQGFGSAFVKRIEGDYAGIVGLPLVPLLRELKKFGIEPK